MGEKIGSIVDLLIPLRLTGRRGLLFSLIISVYIIGMMNFEHPFGNHVETIAHHHWLLSGLGWVCAAIYILSFEVFPLVFKNSFHIPKFFSDWKLFNFSLFVVLMLVANMVYMLFVIPPPEVTLHYSLHIVYYTIVFNLTPILACNYIRIRYFEPVPVEMPETVSEIIPVPVLLQTTVDLRAMNGSVYEKADILYFEVCGNYLKMYMESTGTKTYEMLSGSMAQLEEVLKEHPELMRCHRSYLVNTTKIENCSGNKGLITFYLTNCDKKFNVYNKYIPLFLPFCAKNQLKIE